MTKEVEIIILEKFSSVIDKQIFDKIKANAEKDFTVSTRLKEETFSFVDTYESLFSDKLDVKYIYQDAITGEVVPFFGDTAHIDDSDRRENAMKTRSGIKEPPKVAVKRAYEHYMRLKKYSSDSEAVEIQAEFDELFFDEDAQTFIDGDIEIFEEKSESKEQKSLKDYNVIFLKDSKVLFDVDVPVFVRGNELMQASLKAKMHGRSLLAKVNCKSATILGSLERQTEMTLWVVDIDLEKFFDNVPQDKLMSYVGRVIRDGDTESLIRKYLKAGVMNQGKYEPTDVGTPQGGNLSPLLSNIMLNELDYELDHRHLNFVRYADDVVIVLKSKAAATRVMYSVTSWIERKLGLKVNATKTKVTPPSKLKYLGFGFWNDKGEWKARPHEDSVERLKRKLKALCKRNWSTVKHNEHTDGHKLFAKLVNVIADKAATGVHVGLFCKGVERTVGEKLDCKCNVLCFNLALLKEYRLIASFVFAML